jgi:predicted DNA-binding protein with PD1-like motif
MKYSEGRLGRVFVIRLEQGEVVHEELERFAAEKGVRSATVLMVGGANSGSKLTVGPEDGDARPVVALGHVLSEVHEMAAVGTLFPDDDGRPSLHVHAAVGREGGATVGCIRRGVVVWLILEVIMIEIIDNKALRRRDPDTGFDLLEPSG